RADERQQDGVDGHDDGEAAAVAEMPEPVAELEPGEPDAEIETDEPAPMAEVPEPVTPVDGAEVEDDAEALEPIAAIEMPEAVEPPVVASEPVNGDGTAEAGAARRRPVATLSHGGLA
ncbi:MAG: hypothetical protein OXH97_10705, partial [Chloroflexota bacterium]|nr:hypothetical protein [Chloroflexota bacterium]